MNVTLNDWEGWEAKAILYKSGEKSIRIQSKEFPGDMLIWMTPELARQLRAAVNELYPEAK